VRVQSTDRAVNAELSGRSSARERDRALPVNLLAVSVVGLATALTLISFTDPASCLPNRTAGESLPLRFYNDLDSSGLAKGAERKIFVNLRCDYRAADNS
jgi:hypothetical protein